MLSYRGSLTGHRDMVTAISSSTDMPNRIVTSSRDKTVCVWELGEVANNVPGVAVRSLTGHNQAVQDVVVNREGTHAVSGSWDSTLRMWNLENGQCTAVFKGHTSDVLSVAWSHDGRQIISSGRDKSIRLWNILGSCKYVIENQGQHNDWISCVRFSPSAKTHKVVSVGWDNKVKLWDLSDGKLTHTLDAHRAPLYSVTVSPDGTLCASAGKEGQAILWAIADANALYNLDAGAPINCLAFAPKKYWLCAATDSSIRIFDLEARQPIFQITRKEFEQIYTEANGSAPVKKNGDLPWVVSITWSSDNSYLLAGTSTGEVLVFAVNDVSK